MEIGHEIKTTDYHLYYTMCLKVHILKASSKLVDFIILMSGLLIYLLFVAKMT